MQQSATIAKSISALPKPFSYPQMSRKLVPGTAGNSRASTRHPNSLFSATALPCRPLHYWRTPGHSMPKPDRAMIFAHIACRKALAFASLTHDQFLWSSGTAATPRYQCWLPQASGMQNTVDRCLEPVEKSSIPVGCLCRVRGFLSIDMPGKTRMSSR